VFPGRLGEERYKDVILFQEVLRKPQATLSSSSQNNNFQRHQQKRIQTQFTQMKFNSFSTFAFGLLALTTSVLGTQVPNPTCITGCNNALSACLNSTSFPSPPSSSPQQPFLASKSVSNFQVQVRKKNPSASPKAKPAKPPAL
jgi:hypothetical protein